MVQLSCVITRRAHVATCSSVVIVLCLSCEIVMVVLSCVLLMWLSRDVLVMCAESWWGHVKNHELVFTFHRHTYVAMIIGAGNLVELQVEQN